MTDTVYMVLYFALCPALWILCFVLDRVWPCPTAVRHTRTTFVASWAGSREDTMLPHGQLSTAG